MAPLTDLLDALAHQDIVILVAQGEEDEENDLLEDAKTYLTQHMDSFSSALEASIMTFLSGTSLRLFHCLTHRCWILHGANHQSARLMFPTPQTLNYCWCTSTAGVILGDFSK